MPGGGATRHLTAAAAAAEDDDEDDDDDYVDNYVDKPIFRQAPSNITVSPGDRASLKCRVDNLGSKTVYVTLRSILFVLDSVARFVRITLKLASRLIRD